MARKEEYRIHIKLIIDLKSYISLSLLEPIRGLDSKAPTVVALWI